MNTTTYVFVEKLEQYQYFSDEKKGLIGSYAKYGDAPVTHTVPVCLSKGVFFSFR